MYQPQTAKLNINLRNTFLALSAFIVILTSVVNAQEGMKLRALVEENGFGWMIGEWTATTEEGQSLQTYYKWELDGNLISLGFQMGDVKGRGMIYYDLDEGQVVQVGVDSRGGVVKGFWYADGDVAVAKLYYTGPDGQSNKMGITHAKVDDDTMKVSFFSLGDYDELADEPSGAIDYKRKKEQPAKKTDDKKKSSDSSEQKEKKIKKEPLTIMKVDVVL